MDKQLSWIRWRVRLFLLAGAAVLIGTYGYVASELYRAEQRRAELTSKIDSLRETRAQLEKEVQLQKKDQEEVEADLEDARERYDRLREQIKTVENSLRQRGISEKHLEVISDHFAELESTGHEEGPSDAAIPPSILSQLKRLASQGRISAATTQTLFNNNPWALEAYAQGLLELAVSQEGRGRRRELLVEAEELIDLALSKVDETSRREIAELRATKADAEKIRAELERGTVRKELLQKALGSYEYAMKHLHGAANFDAYRSAVRVQRELHGKYDEAVYQFACSDAQTSGYSHRANHCAGLMQYFYQHYRNRDATLAARYACRAAEVFVVDAPNTKPEPQRKRLERYKKMCSDAKSRVDKK